MSARTRNRDGDTVTGSLGDPRRINVIRDGLAAALLVAGLLLPWNLRAGLGIPGTAGWVAAVVIVASMLSLAAVVLRFRGGYDESDASRTRAVLLTAPYLVVAGGFVAVTVVQSVRFGGSGAVPPGIGPGVWFGSAGAVLAALPPAALAENDSRWSADKALRVVGIGSIVLASAATVFNLYWRTRFVIPHIGDPGTGAQNSVVVVAAVLYAVAALVPVLIVGRWMMSGDASARLATVLLGAATVLGGAAVWILPVGRELDAFHGIAQNTSTAGVGFEGFLAWAVGAALVGTVVALGAPQWRAASRRCLLLIAVWCGASALERIVDLISVSVLDLPAPPYSGTALMAFDLVVAVLAVWLYLNHGARSAVPQTVSALLLGILATLTICRVILGVALAARVQPLNATDINSVYGNTQVQQLTGTFDVVLCVVALALLAVAFTARARPAQPRRVRVAPDSVTSYTLADDGSVVVAADVAATDTATVRIARPQTGSAGQDSAEDRVAAVLAESTRRFAAGTTYGAGTTKDR